MLWLFYGTRGSSMRSPGRFQHSPLSFHLAYNFTCCTWLFFRFSFFHNVMCQRQLRSLPLRFNLYSSPLICRCRYYLAHVIFLIQSVNMSFLIVCRCLTLFGVLFTLFVTITITSSIQFVHVPPSLSLSLSLYLYIHTLYIYVCMCIAE